MLLTETASYYDMYIEYKLFYAHVVETKRRYLASFDVSILCHPSKTPFFYCFNRHVYSFAHLNAINTFMMATVVTSNTTNGRGLGFQVTEALLDKMSIHRRMRDADSILLFDI